MDLSAPVVVPPNVYDDLERLRRSGVVDMRNVTSVWRHVRIAGMAAGTAWLSDPENRHALFRGVFAGVQPGGEPIELPDEPAGERQVEVTFTTTVTVPADADDLHVAHAAYKQLEDRWSFAANVPELFDRVEQDCTFAELSDA